MRERNRPDLPQFSRQSVPAALRRKELAVREAMRTYFERFAKHVEQPTEDSGAARDEALSELHHTLGDAERAYGRLWSRSGTKKAR